MGPIEMLGYAAYGFVLTITLMMIFDMLPGFIISILIQIFIFPGLNEAKAETYYSFKYKTKDELKISVPAADYFEARTKASKLCFQALTRGEYQGEEESLRIIDVCANPLKGN